MPMTNELNALSLTIGELRADMREGAKQRDAIFSELKNITSMMATHTTEFRLLVQKVSMLDEDRATLSKQIKMEVLPVVEDYKSSKKSLLMLASGVGLGSGGVGSALIKWLLGH